MCVGLWNAIDVIVSYLRKELDPDTQTEFLSGTIRYPLPTGSIVMLRKQDSEYVLIAVTDGRPAGSRDPQSLLSFVDEEAIKRPTPEDLKRRKPKGGKS